MKIRAAMTETRNVGGLDSPSDLLRVDMPVDASVIENIRSANVAHNIDLIRAAHKKGAQIICLSELCTAPYFAITGDPDEKWRGFAESVEDGRSVAEFCEISRETGMTVIAPIYERDDIASVTRFYNTAVVIENGVVLGISRKTHVPHGRNEQAPYTEGFYYGCSDEVDQNAGRKKVGGSPLVPVFDTQVGKVGMAICYARHFEENWEALALGGARIVFVPAITFGDVSERAWEFEAPTEAMRRKLLVGQSNRKGREFAGGPEFFGKTKFFGPDGRELENLSDRSDLVVVEFDLEDLKADPSGWNLPGNHRTDLMDM
jgi:beta-ureidopropionase